MADELTQDQLFEWWAYGYLHGWFPVKQEKRAMDPQAALEYFQRLGNG